MRLHRMSNEN